MSGVTRYYGSLKKDITETDILILTLKSDSHMSEKRDISRMSLTSSPFYLKDFYFFLAFT